MNELRGQELFSFEPMEEMFRNFFRPGRHELTERVPQMRVDVDETDSNFLVRADVPGVRKEDIEVKIEGNQVTICAEVKKEREEKKEGGRVLRAERQYGWAARTFTLNSAVDESKSVAKYQNGVLELMLPKKASTTSKRLQIA